MLAKFKKEVRKIASESLIPAEANLFLASKAHTNRLAEFGVVNKQPAIRAMPQVSREDAIKITQAILSQMGIKSTVRINRWKAGQLEVVQKKLTEKGLPAWLDNLAAGEDWTAQPLHSEPGGDKLKLRTIYCNHCKNANRIRNKQLVRQGGTWGLIKCTTCAAMRSTRNWTCSCGTLWHKCAVHYYTAESKSVMKASKLKTASKYGNDDPVPQKLRLNETQRGEIREAQSRPQLKETNGNHKPLDKLIKHRATSWRSRKKRTVERQASHQNSLSSSDESQATGANDKHGHQAHQADTVVNGESGDDGTEAANYKQRNPSSESKCDTCDTRIKGPPVGFCSVYAHCQCERFSCKHQVSGNSHRPEIINPRTNDAGCESHHATTTRCSNGDLFNNERANERQHGTAINEQGEHSGNRQRKGDDEHDELTRNYRPEHAHTPHIDIPTDGTHGNAQAHSNVTYVPSLAGGEAEACQHPGCLLEVHAACTECHVNLCIQHHDCSSRRPSRCHEHDNFSELCQCAQCKIKKAWIDQPVTQPNGNPGTNNDEIRITDSDSD